MARYHKIGQVILWKIFVREKRKITLLKKFFGLLLVAVLAYLVFLCLHNKYSKDTKPTLNNSTKPIRHDLYIIKLLKGMHTSIRELLSLTDKQDVSRMISESLKNEVNISTLQKLHSSRGHINETYYRTFLQENNISIPYERKKCSNEYKVLILVQTYINHTSRRDVIRRTWGNCSTNDTNYVWRVLFIIGKATEKKHIQIITDELTVHDDLLLVNTIDSFHNLTEKLQKSFQWIAKYCRFQYLLKADDDVFINIASLYDYLNQKNTPRTGLFTGRLLKYSVVIRSGRYEPEKKYKRTVYPRYCSGGGYVLSRDLVLRFIDLFDYVPYLRIDDAYLGELALKAGIDLVNNNEFFMGKSGTTICEDYKDSNIVIHPVKTEECMLSMFKNATAAFSRIGKDASTDVPATNA